MKLHEKMQVEWFFYPDSRKPMIMRATVCKIFRTRVAILVEGEQSVRYVTPENLRELRPMPVLAHA